MRRSILILLAVNALCATAVGPPTNVRAAELSIRQLVTQTKKIPVALWRATSVTVQIDEHDLVVEFRVSEGDKRQKESLLAFIELASEFGEREKIHRVLLFAADTDCEPDLRGCSFTLGKPLPALGKPVAARTR